MELLQLCMTKKWQENYHTTWYVLDENKMALPPAADSYDS